MQQALVGSHDIFLLCPRQCTLSRDMRGPKAVVIQRKDWRDDAGTALPFPVHIRIFGRQHTMASRDLYAFHVFGFAPERLRGAGHGVELMVAGDPEDVFEARRRFCKSGIEMVGCFADVAGDDEAVVEVGAQRVQGFAVELVADVEIGNGIEAHPWREGGMGEAV